jgi:hypothetical protein
MLSCVCHACVCLPAEDGIALRGLFIIDKEGVVQHATINNLAFGRSVDETMRTLQVRKQQARQVACTGSSSLDHKLDHPAYKLSLVVHCMCFEMSVRQLECAALADVVVLQGAFNMPRKQAYVLAPHYMSALLFFCMSTGHPVRAEQPRRGGYKHAARLCRCIFALLMHLNMSLKTIGAQVHQSTTTAF